MQISENCRFRKQRKRTGQSLIETLAGFMLLIPIGLFSYDLTYILIASQNNEKLADSAARAAANHGDPVTAQKSVQQAIDDYQQTAAYGPVTLDNFTYDDQSDGQVSLSLKLEVKIPVVFGSWKTMTVSALAVQPIVGIPEPQ